MRINDDEILRSVDVKICRHPNNENEIDLPSRFKHHLNQNLYGLA